MHRHKNFPAILRKHGVRPFEFDLLDAMEHRDGTNTTDQILSFVQSFYFTKVPRGAYAIALRSCLRKGWLRVLTEEECLNERKRWTGFPNQYAELPEWRAGAVHFTQAGAELYEDIIKDWSGDFGEKPHQGHVNYNYPQYGQIEFLGPYYEDVLSGLNADYTEEEQTFFTAQDENLRFVVDKREGPFLMRNWWLTRFVKLATGWNAILHYHFENADGEIVEVEL